MSPVVEYMTVMVQCVYGTSTTEYLEILELRCGDEEIYKDIRHGYWARRENK